MDRTPKKKDIKIIDIKNKNAGAHWLRHFLDLSY